MGEFVGKRVVPDHVGVWDQKKTYEPLMIVLDGETGDSYISRKAVPVGISLADESYWSLCAHYSAQMRKLEQDVDVDVQQMHSDVTAVKNAMSQEFKETHTAISKELDDTHKAISQELSETEQRVNENLEQTSSELTGKVEQAKSDLNTGRQELKDAKDTLNKRMDSIAGGKTSDAEILDARVDSYGHTHNTLGNAIRALRAGEMREAVHEQLAEKYVQELLETEVKKIHGGELYYPYDSSTFSGWVSSYLIAADNIFDRFQTTCPQHGRDSHKEGKFRRHIPRAPDHNGTDNSRTGAGRTGNQREHLKHTHQQRRFIGYIA